MATVTARKPVAQVQTARKVVQTGKAVAHKPVADGFAVVSIDTIDFLPSGRGGGKPMDPAVQKLVDKALSLQIGQGFKVPQSMRLNREIKGANGTSTLYTYKGAPSLSKRAKAQDMRFRTRRDTAQNLWLFRVEPLEYVEVAEEEGA